MDIKESSPHEKRQFSIDLHDEARNRLISEINVRPNKMDDQPLAQQLPPQNVKYLDFANKTTIGGFGINGKKESKLTKMSQFG